MSQFKLKRGDRYPPLVAVLKDENGPVNLTGCTVRFHMRFKTGVVKVDQPATIVGAAIDGRVSYSWGATDTNIAGIFDAEFEVLLAGSLPYTFPNGSHDEILIWEDIA